MNHAARDYLLPSCKTYWQWNEDTDVITWEDGTTVAFRKELYLLLQNLAPTGLPSLGGILLLIAATRENWQESNNSFFHRLASILADGGIFTAQQLDRLAGVFTQLTSINHLAAELRSNTPARATLIEMVFDGLRDRGTPAEAAQILTLLEHGLGEAPPARNCDPQSSKDGAQLLLRDLASLRHGLHRVTPEALKNRLQTGIEQLPGAAPLDVEDAAKVRNLLAELRQDDEFRGLSDLARELMAAVSLPRTVSQHEDIPIGGFSDISNRGTLDRLLLSELSNDDLLLSVRVAMNEAMYLRRESPPKSPTRHRTIFLETGIRSWGIPRIFASAVALALASSCDPKTTLSTYRAEASLLKRVDLTTREGLLAHFAVLQTEMHPGSALPAIKQIAFEADDSDEAILVTTEDAFSDPEFQEAMTNEGLAPFLIATVTRDGSFRLYERTTRGTKKLREAQFSLEELFRESNTYLPSTLHSDQIDQLPAIFSVDPFPLTLAQRVNTKRAWRVEHEGVLAISNDQRLLLWNNPHRGPLQISDSIPPGALWWSTHQPDEHECVEAIVGCADPKGLTHLSINLRQRTCAATPFPVARGIREIASHQGAIFGIYHKHIAVFVDHRDSSPRSVDFPPEAFYHKSRFFRSHDGNQWYALSFDGRKARFEPFITKRHRACPRIREIFEADHFDGFYALTVEGDIYSTASAECFPLQHGLKEPLIEAISSNGQKIVLSDSTASHEKVLFNMSRMQCHPRNTSDPFATAEGLERFNRPANLRSRFKSIFIGEDGQITLTSKKNKDVSICYSPQSSTIRLLPNADARPRNKRLTFKPVNIDRNVGYHLSVATWEDGSEAFLDSRGLLHLRSASSRAIPEATLVLSDTQISGWAADGRMWGSPYFIGGHAPTPAAEIFPSVIQAFAERAQ